MAGNKWIRAAREGRMLRDKAGRFMVPRVVRTGVSLAPGDQERQSGWTYVYSLLPRMDRE